MKTSSLKTLKEFSLKFKDLNLNTDWRERDMLEFHMSRVAKATRTYKINTTGNCCVGDKILFIRRLWERQSINRFGKMANVVVGYELLEATIIRDSYGKEKQQHTFTLLLKDKSELRIKGRNLYAVGVWRKARDEQERTASLNEKYSRGNVAREARSRRLNNAPDVPHTT